MKHRNRFGLIVLFLALLSFGVLSAKQTHGSETNLLEEEDEEGTLPEGWIEIGDHEYMNPSTGEWAKVHVKEQSSSTDSPTQERR